MQRTDGQARIEASAVTIGAPWSRPTAATKRIVHLGDITEAIQHGQVLPGERHHPEPFRPIDQVQEFSRRPRTSMPCAQEQDFGDSDRWDQSHRRTLLDRVESGSGAVAES